MLTIVASSALGARACGGAICDDGSSPRPSLPKQAASALVGQGLDHLEKKRYEQAVQAFRGALELDPSLAIARYDLGVAYFELSKFKEAKECFEQVRRQDPGHQFARYFLARTDLIEGEYESAIRGFQGISRPKPVADELYYLGTAYFRKGDFPQAVRILQRALVWKPGDYRVHLLLARAYQKIGRTSEAQRYYLLSEEVRETYRKKAREILECKVSLNSEPFEGALERCRQLLDGDDPTKLVMLGVLLAEHERYEHALPPLAKAAQIDPENYEPHFNLGLTYFKMKRYQEAKQSLEQAVALRPASYDAVALLGSVLFALGDDYAAVSYLRRGHELNPADPKVETLLFEQLRIIGQHLLSNREYKESIPYLEEALALRPGATEVRSQLAEARAALEDLVGDEQGKISEPLPR